MDVSTFVALFLLDFAFYHTAYFEWWIDFYFWLWKCKIKLYRTLQFCSHTLFNNMFQFCSHILFNNMFCAADFLFLVIYLMRLIFFIFGYLIIQHCTLHSWPSCFSKKNCSHNINTYTYLTLECDTLLNLFAFKQPHLNDNAIQLDFQFFIAYLLLVYFLLLWWENELTNIQMEQPGINLSRNLESTVQGWKIMKSMIRCANIFPNTTSCTYINKWHFDFLILMWLCENC